MYLKATWHACVCSCVQPRPHLLTGPNTVHRPPTAACTDTRTNIQILADAFASQGQPHPVHVLDNQHPAVFNTATNTHVAYFNGCGASGQEDEV